MTLNLPWTPTFEFGAAKILTLTYPVTRWNPGGRTEGRMLHTVNGAQGVSLRLRKYLLGMNLRFLESEQDAVFEFLTTVQVSPDPFTWVINAQDPDIPETVEVWWESPQVQEAIRPVRDGSYQTLFTIPITVSRMSAPWDLEYFRLPE